MCKFLNTYFHMRSSELYEEGIVKPSADEKLRLTGDKSLTQVHRVYNCWNETPTMAGLTPEPVFILFLYAPSL